MLGLRRGLSSYIPARKHDGMALQCAGEHFGSFHAQVDSIIPDGRDRGLRNSRPFGQLVLTQALKLAKDANGLTNADPSSDDLVYQPIQSAYPRGATVSPANQGSRVMFRGRSVYY